MWIIELENLLLEELLSEWEPFLFSRDVYWPGYIKRKNLPSTYKNLRISAGRLLIATKLLSEEVVRNVDVSSVIVDNLQKFNELTNQWKSNWTKKIEIEIPFRARQWQRIIKEIDLDRDYSSYQLVNDLQIRLIFGLLVDKIDLSDKTNYLELVNISDLKFRSLTFENDFVWDDQFSVLFDHDQFWYLYRTVSDSGGKK